MICRLLLLACLVFVNLVSLVDFVSAQTPPQPSVTLRRFTSLHRDVLAADFNKDGILDLVATRNQPGPAPMVMSLGRADGTFAPAQTIAAQGRALSAGDFNNDGNLDIVGAWLPPPDDQIRVFAGDGRGNFATTSHHVTDYASHVIAEAADFNGDGNLDLVFSAHGEPPAGIEVALGNGDMTFDFDDDSRAYVATGPGAHGLAVGDLNDDGRPDIVVANNGGEHGDTPSVSVLINQGALLFTHAQTLSVPAPAHDVAVADMNRDGNLDIVSAGGSTVVVWLNQGNGTFPNGGNEYAITGAGAVGVAVGDVNRDGLLDVVTSNRSAQHIADCSAAIKGVNTVSVLPGRGNGTLAAGSTFAVGDQANPGGWQGSAGTVRLADISRDGRLDILVPYGDALITTAPDPNWAPTVNLGPDATVEQIPFELRARVNDVDQDAVSFAWTHSGGLTLPPIPNPCVSNLGPGTHTFTVTVDDRQGHTATDSVTYTVPGEPSAPVITVTAPSAGEVLDAGVPYTVRWTADRDAFEWFLWYSGDGGQNWSRMWECMYLTPGARSCTWNSPWPPGTRIRVRVVANPDEGPTGVAESANFTVADRGAGGLPAYWESRDIGAVGAAGSARYDQGTWTVRGSGADVWGTADEFHFVSYRDAGEITARIASVQNVNRWTKVGLMVRSVSGGAGAAHASIFVTPTVEKGIAFQRRTTANGQSVSTAGPAITAPVWLKLVQDDNVVSAYYRKNITDAWTLVGSETMPQNFVGELGLVVSSHVDGTLATATFDNVTTSVPRGLTSTDIGAVGVPGRTSFSGVTVTLEGSGADIWGTADAFRFAHSQFGDTAAVTARVRSIENTHVWAKAGVMIRADTSPGSPFVMVLVSPGKGVAMQYRRTRNGTSESAQFAGAAPRWVRLTRDGEWLVGWVSSNGTTWSEIARVLIAEIDHESLAGLAVTSHNNGTLATAVFDDIRFDRPNGY